MSDAWPPPPSNPFSFVVCGITTFGEDGKLIGSKDITNEINRGNAIRACFYKPRELFSEFPGWDPDIISFTLERRT